MLYLAGGVLCLLIAIIYVGHSRRKDQLIQKRRTFAQSLKSEYFSGINFLLNEQPDKAVDVFIKLLEADSDTVETHLALGSLFRRRGEVDRAIRIHQNLIARPNLSPEHRSYSLYELGQDYMSAGVLDRAEALFLELVEHGAQCENSLCYLLDIYQQQRDWEHAVNIARKLETISGRKMANVIAHFYCELAERAQSAGLLDKASRYTKQALSIYVNCVRANIQQAELFMSLGKNKAAIISYKNVLEKGPHYLLEILESMIVCYERQDRIEAFIDYLHTYLQKHPLLLVLGGNVFAKIRQYYGDKKCAEFIVHQLEMTPTIQGVKSFIDLQLSQPQEVKEHDKWQLLQSLIEKLLDNIAKYQCSHCGFSSQVLYWYCPSCKHWDTVTLVTGFQTLQYPIVEQG